MNISYMASRVRVTATSAAHGKLSAKELRFTKRTKYLPGKLFNIQPKHYPKSQLPDELLSIK